MPASIPGGDYVLGTGDDEIRRLALQHAVWRPYATDAWRRAGFTAGQRLADVGCGPGHATLDLAAVAGPDGRLSAIDRSRPFLNHLIQQTRGLGVRNVEVIESDLDTQTLPRLDADGTWCRWIFAFVRRPRELLAGVRNLLRPGGALVLHEYFNYASWRLVPAVSQFETFVATVMRSWRDNGGEPDIALRLLPWLDELGMEVVSLRPIIAIVRPGDFMWQWPSAFVTSGLARLVELGYLTPASEAEIRTAFDLAVARPGVRMVTPAVLEVIARRPE